MNFEIEKEIGNNQKGIPRFLFGYWDIRDNSDKDRV